MFILKVVERGATSRVRGSGPRLRPIPTSIITTHQLGNIFLKLDDFLIFFGFIFYSSDFLWENFNNFFHFIFKHHFRWSRSIQFFVFSFKPTC